MKYCAMIIGRDLFSSVCLVKRMLFTLLSSWLQTLVLFFCLYQPLFLHKLRASSYLHAVASENAGDAPQSSSTRSPRSESREVLSLHTNHIFPWMSKKHTVNKMIHQLENRDGQSGGYCQATCGFASSTRETESPVEAPTNNSIINSYKWFVLDKRPTAH